jgi:hypothetical protein
MDSPLLPVRAPVGIFVGPLEAIWVTALFVWLSVHVYVYPLLLAQERSSPLLAYRNAAVLALGRPGFTTVVLALWLLVLLFTAGTGLVTVIGLALGVAIQQSAYLRIVPEFVADR